MALFTAGVPLTAAQLNALGLYAVKTADQSVTSSTTLVNDTHLSITLPSVGSYLVDVWLYALSAANAAGDLAVGFTYPTGTLNIGGAGPDSALASGNIEPGQWGAALSQPSGTIFNSYGLSTGAVTIHLHGLFIATATGTLQLQWAQLASNANASTLKAGSHMLVRQVA